MHQQGHWQGKFWGKTKELFDINGVQAKPLVVDPGALCSEHKHTARYNLFYVASGKLLVRIWKSSTDSPDVITLNPGDSTLVEPGLYHQFEALGGEVHGVEFYWTDVGDEDISRRTEGAANREEYEQKRTADK